MYFQENKEKLNAYYYYYYYYYYCLFSCRYNPLWLYFHSPIAGFSLLVFEVS
jgi:hypothetical protein